MPLTTDGPVSVLVADAQPLYRDALLQVLEADGIDCLGAVGGGRVAMEVVDDLRPGVLVADVHLPELDGLALAQRLRRRASATRVLCLSDAVGGDIVLRAFESGVAGYGSKTADPAELVQGVREVAAGRAFLSPSLTRAVAEALAARGETPMGLSLRELEILQGLAHGESVADMASRLTVAVPTLKSHVQLMYAKLGVHDRAAAVAEGLRRGLIE